MVIGSEEWVECSGDGAGVQAALQYQAEGNPEGLKPILRQALMSGSKLRPSKEKPQKVRGS
jgi:hypothetical protein